MRSEKVRFMVTMAMLLMMLPLAVSANVVWPSLFIVTGMMSWYIIAAGLVIETLFIKRIIKPSWLKSIVMAVGMNVASAIIGLVLIPASGLLVEVMMIPFDSITFATPNWVLSYIFAVLCNVLVEGLFLKIVFKLEFKKNFKWLFVANAISVVLAITTMGFYMDSIDM